MCACALPKSNVFFLNFSLFFMDRIQVISIMQLLAIRWLEWIFLKQNKQNAK